MAGCKKILTKGLVVLAFAVTAPAAHAADLQYKDLPAAAKAYAEEVRASCKDYNADGVPKDKLAGITQMTLADGTPAILLDNETLCNDHYTGANCSNRGCDAVIMIQSDAADKSWKQIFNEHLYDKTFNIDANKQLQSITAWVYAGDPHCGTPAVLQLQSRDACQVEIKYQNKDWNWTKLPDVSVPLAPPAPR